MTAAVLLIPSAVSPANAVADVLLSQGKPVATSTQESSSLSGAKAVDGNTKTRWASAVSADPQWLRVDLGQASTVHRVKITWEAAYAKRYRLEISDDGTHFTTITTVDNGDGGTDDVPGLNAHGRYLRFVGTTRATKYGYSFWELQAYGEQAVDNEPPSTPNGLAAGTTTASSIALSWQPATDNIGVAGYDILRNGQPVATSATTDYTDTGLTPDTQYTYSVRAKDAAGNTSPASTTVTARTKAGSTGAFVLAAAGDIAEQCTASDSGCVHPKTAKLVDQINPVAVITMGDNQYDNATISDFRNYYDKTWGRFKNITHPIPGNHEHYDSPEFAGYHAYFGTIATPHGKNYYSWELGNWHFIALDSNDFTTHDDLAEADPPQIAWLKEDLATNTKGCIAAYYHHPRWSSGDHGDNKDSILLWQTLVNAKVDLVLNGHDHDYERFVPMNADGKSDPNGPVEIVGGSGGAGLYDLKAAHATTAKLLKTHGVLKLSMTDTTFQTQLIGLNGTTLDSSPTYSCH
ncbi:discoidin domain-containing protein [Actinocrispum sp. NPDC049592]|uniref:discoidin domain-containing protein n=1 Tax=Actinocrispum sp. NPDC049592 TaxID=3154835 RepID=UPI00343BC0DD